MKKVLILCTGNSCRSIMAEALINAKLIGIRAYSSGVKASGKVNPNAKKVLIENKIWCDNYHSKTIENVINNHYDLVVTVCDNAKESCPIFPKSCEVLHVGFEDPDGEVYDKFVTIYNQIEKELLPLIQEKLNPKKNILIIATGGTIAGVGQNSSYSAGKVEISELLKSVKGVEKVANLSFLQLYNLGSQDMNETHWLELTKVTCEALKKYDGVVITHGTDTLEEGAYFLDLCIKGDKNVVFTCAMRASNTLSSDGAMNLYNAICVACEPRGGVMVVVNDEIHSPCDVTKAHTTNLNAFISPNRGKIGSVYFGKVRYYGQPTPKKVLFEVENLNTLPRVEILYGSSSTILTSAILQTKPDGIVVAGVGNGNISKENIKLLSNSVVVRSSRVGAGRVYEGVEIDDKAHNFLVAGLLNPQKTRILLMLALGTKKDNLSEIFSLMA